MTDLQVTLGSVTFEDFEVPEALPFGGAQMLSIKRLIGGRKVIDAMGSDEEPIEWSGRFRGPNAQARARAVDAMRQAGRAVALTWGEFSFNVVIQRFRPVFERVYEIPYSITCEVIGSAPQPSEPGVDHMMAGDNATAQALGAKVGDTTLTGLLGNLDGAVASVSKFATASQATLNSVLDPIQAVQSRVSTLIASTANTMGSVTSLGGVIPNNPLARLAGQLTTQVTSVTRYADLYELDAVTGRMGANIEAIGSGGAKYVAAGGNLFDISARAYGDATNWTAIAKVNGLMDPVLAGVQELLIPPNPISTGGVPQT